jgi:pimeloyl-ACP methyl ester carboxylesterase
MPNLPPLGFAALLLATLGAVATPAAAGCGEVVTLATHGSTKTSYSLAMPAGAASGDPIALVLLAGGSGFIDLGADGCPRALVGNSLARARPLWNGQGFATALVDAPTGYHGEDGLGGFRLSAQHAADLGKVIADVRRRTNTPVWLVGTSRGAISAANAAARLKGTEAPDGLVLTSAVTVGNPGGRKPWVAQTVFDLALESITMPVLVVAHASDRCIRTPPSAAGRIAARTRGQREQTVKVTGGPGGGGSGLEACEGRTPHGFLGQDEEVAAGIARFVRGGTY